MAEVAVEVDVTAFDAAARALAGRTGMTPTQARGTLRLLLKDAHSSARIATKAELVGIARGPLLEALHRCRVKADGSTVAAVVGAVEAADETDPLALFSDLD